MQSASTSAWAVGNQAHTSQNPCRYKHRTALLTSDDGTTQRATLLPWKQQAQMCQNSPSKELTAHPVLLKSNVHAGKLHKSLLSQVLAALATCRKLPPGHKHREEIDWLLQHVLALAHEAVVACSAAAVAQLEPQQQQQQQQQQQETTTPQQQQHQQQHQQQETTTPQQQQQHQRQEEEEQISATTVQQHQALATTRQQQEGKKGEEEEQEGKDVKAKAHQSQPEELATAGHHQNQQQQVATHVVAPKSAASPKQEKHVTWHTEPTKCLIPAPSDTPFVAATDLKDNVLSAAISATPGGTLVALPEAAAAATAAEKAASSEQLRAFVEGMALGPLLEFSWASKWSHSTSSCGESSTAYARHAEQYSSDRKHNTDDDGQQLRLKSQKWEDVSTHFMQCSPLPQQQQNHIAALTTPEEQQQQQQQQAVSSLLTSEDGSGSFLPYSNVCHANFEQSSPSRARASGQMQTLYKVEDCSQYTQGKQVIHKQQKQQYSSQSGEQDGCQLLAQQQQQQQGEQCSHGEEELKMFRQYSRSLGGCVLQTQHSEKQSTTHPAQHTAAIRGAAGNIGKGSKCHTAKQSVGTDLPTQAMLLAVTTAVGTASSQQGGLCQQTPCMQDNAQSVQVPTRPQNGGEHQRKLQLELNKQQQQWQLEQPLLCKDHCLDAHELQPDCALDSAWSIGSAWLEDTSSTARPAGAADPEVQPLVGTLSSGDKLLQRAAANTLMDLAYNCAETRAVAARAGAIAPLVAMLSGSSCSCQIAAAGALSNLCIDNEDIQAAVAQLGGVHMLCNMLSSCSTSMQRAAVRALNNLAWEVDNRAVIAEAGGIPRLVQLLGSACADVQEHAAATLMNLARDVVFGIPVAIAETGGIPTLVRLLDSACNDGVKDSAAGALMNLAYSTPGNRAAIAAAGGITALITLLTTKNKSVQRSAAGALKNLLRDSPHNQAVVADAGGIPVLAWILNGSRDDVKLEAAGALWNLIQDNPENQAELAAVRGIQPLMDMLDVM